MSTTALSVHKRNINVLAQLIDKKKPTLAELTPPGVSLDQITRVALFEAMDNEKLAMCGASTRGQMTFYKCVSRACELGLVAGGGLSRAHLIPREDRKTGEHYCTLLIGYTGLMDLARR